MQEGVVETITALRAAGVTPWMLTGDKKETAVNLAHAAGLVVSLDKTIDLCEVQEKDVAVLLDQLRKEVGETSQTFL